MAKHRTRQKNTGYSEEHLRRRIYWLVFGLLQNDLPIAKVRTLCRTANSTASTEESGSARPWTLAEKAITESLVQELIGV